MQLSLRLCHLQLHVELFCVSVNPASFNIFTRRWLETGRLKVVRRHARSKGANKWDNANRRIRHHLLIPGAASHCKSVMERRLPASSKARL